MNVAVGTTSTQTWGILKRHYLLALAGVVLACVVAVGAVAAVTWSADDGATIGSTENRFLSYAAPDRSVDVYYLVESEAQGSLLLRAEAEASAANMNPVNVPVRRIHILLAATPEQEAYIGQLFSETEFGEGLQVIDVRPHPLPIVDEPIALTPLEPHAVIGEEPSIALNPCMYPNMDDMTIEQLALLGWC